MNSTEKVSRSEARCYKYRKHLHKGKHYIEVGILVDGNIIFHKPKRDISVKEEISSYRKYFEKEVVDEEGECYMKDVLPNNQIIQLSIDCIFNGKNDFLQYYNSIGVLIDDEIIYWDQYLV